MPAYFVTTKHVDNIRPANTVPEQVSVREMPKRHTCKSTLAICTHSPERVLPAKHQTRRRYCRGELATDTCSCIRTMGIASSTGEYRPSSIFLSSLAGGTVRKSKSNLVSSSPLFDICEKWIDGAACANEQAREPTSKLQSHRCADGERTPFQSVRMMCVGGSSCRWTRGRSIIIDRQGEVKEENAGSECCTAKGRALSNSPTNITRQPGRRDHHNAPSLSHAAEAQLPSKQKSNVHIQPRIWFRICRETNLHLYLHLPDPQAPLCSTPPFLTSAGTTARPCLSANPERYQYFCYS
jgi:hypothetical protein